MSTKGLPLIVSSRLRGLSNFVVIGGQAWYSRRKPCCGWGMDDLIAAIENEIYRALEILGSDERPTREEMYSALDRAGADRFILGVVGSWGEGGMLPDAGVLSDLRDLNNGTFAWESIAHRKEPWESSDSEEDDQTKGSPILH